MPIAARAPRDRSGRASHQTSVQTRDLGWGGGVSIDVREHWTTPTHAKEPTTMRRLLLGAVAASLLALAGSATALAAHHGKRHHRTHYAARHRHRHHHATGARLLRFGVAAFNTSGAATKSPDASSDENAGTVKSFTG